MIFHSSCSTILATSIYVISIRTSIKRNQCIVLCEPYLMKAACKVWADISFLRCMTNCCYCKYFSYTITPCAMATHCPHSSDSLVKQIIILFRVLNKKHSCGTPQAGSAHWIWGLIIQLSIPILVYCTTCSHSGGKS